jgi:predicted nicotinamide N-methyase
MGVLELGTGCGIVGLTLAALVPNSHVVLTDLPEAREIVERNMDSLATQLGNGSTLAFEELDWDADLPAWFARSQSRAKTELVLASDCTYNSDSRYEPPRCAYTVRHISSDLVTDLHT